MAFLTNKFPRIQHFPFSPGAKNDDRIIAPDYMEHLKGKKLIYTEKLDGENCCLTQDGVYARSHAVFNKNAWASYLWAIQATIKNDLNGLQIFGENMYAIHSIEYTKLPEYFFVFAIRDGDLWYSWNEVKYFARHFNFPTVPQYEFDGVPETDGEMEALILTLMKKPHFGDTCEGIVVRDADFFTLNDDNFGYNVLKYVRKGHVQTDEHWTKHWRKATLI